MKVLRLPHVHVLRAFWSQLVGISGIFTGSWGLLVLGTVWDRSIGKGGSFQLRISCYWGVAEAEA